jgi:hypothetical protein
MFKKLLGWRRKILSKPDSTEPEIRGHCAKTHRVEGTSHGYRWQLCLIHKNGDTLTEISQSAARFNEDKSGIVAFFLNEDRLEDYLMKRVKNYEWLQKGGRGDDLPYAPQVLATSNVCGNIFNLNDVASAIQAVERDSVKGFGKVPLTPSLLPYKSSGSAFKLYIKVYWNGKE